MTKKDIELLLTYNRWANQQSLSATARLTPQEFVQDLRSSHRSVRDTVVHGMWAEWIWLMRWQGKSPRTVFDPRDYPDIGSIRTRWSEITNEQLSFVGTLNDVSLEKVLTYTNTQGEAWSYPLWQMIYHAVNHSTYHRGQIVTLLRQLGANVATTDFLVYIDNVTPGG